MALPDIKDAGALAGFTVWGSPYHGLVTRIRVNPLGTIGTTGVSHPVPEYVDMTPWLIDMGLAPIVRSPGELLADAALNHEWRNYALIPGGYVYSKHIGEQSYIHVDTNKDCWRVALAYSWPSYNVIRITATIDRFGKFQRDTDDVPADVVKVVDVTCEMIDPTAAAPNLIGTGYEYLYNTANLEDVYTNGAKAMVGVFLHTGVTDNNKDLFSLIDVVLTGVGGTDGSTLSLAATEIKGRSQTTVAVTGNSIYARYGFYNPSGDTIAVRYGVGGTPNVELFRRILENNTVVDHLTFTLSNTAPYTVVTGSLAAHFTPIAGHAVFGTGTPFDNAFRSNTPYNYYCCSQMQDNNGPSGLYLGIHRMSSKVTVFFFWNGSSAKIYGLASTPIGAVTPTLAVDSGNNFAFQRKTGAYTFSNDLICYV